MQHHYQSIACDLLQAPLLAGHRVCLRVVGGSMQPIMRSGDLLWIEGVAPCQLRRGDLVAFRQGSHLITHRLVACDADGWYARGDSCAQLDPRIPADQIIGRVVCIQRDGAALHMRARRWTLYNRAMGWLGWLHALLLRLMYTADHRAAAWWLARAARPLGRVLVVMPRIVSRCLLALAVGSLAR